MSNLNGRIFTEEIDGVQYGVSIRDIQTVIGDSSKDIGNLCRSAGLNPYSVHKPVRSALWGGTEQQVKVPAKYGWDIDVKNPGSAGNTDTFITQLRTQGDSYAHWRLLLPRGVNNDYTEPYRILDFEGYNQRQLPYRAPLYLNRLTATPILDNQQQPLEGNPLFMTIPLRQASTQVIETDTFTLTDAYDVSVVVSIVDPNPESSASFMHWDVDGDFQVQLVDAQGHIVDSDYNTGFGILTGNIPQKLVFHFENFRSLAGYTAPYFIRYRAHFENNSYFFNGSSDEYVPVQIKIDTTYAQTLAIDNEGQDGVVVRLSGTSSEWNENGYLARETVFGANGSWPIVCVEVNNGTTMQRKLALVPSSGFIPFKRIGITIQPRVDTSLTDIIVYLLYGNYSRIFPQIQDGYDYGDVSLADSEKLTVAPNCYNAIGILPTPPPPMVVYQDDCQGADIHYTNGVEETGLTPNAYGFTQVDYSISYFSLAWGFGIDNLTAQLPVVAKLNILNSDDDIVASKTVETTATGTYWTYTFEFEFPNELHGYAAHELYAVLSVEVNGDLYYIQFYPQKLVSSLPEPYRLGTETS